MTNKKDCVKFVLYQKKVVILHAIKNDRGEMPEWSIGAVSKTVVPFRYPGFESLSLRKIQAKCQYNRHLAVLYHVV